MNWISVKDDLPEDLEIVLASYPPIYTYRVVTFWVDGGGNPHFGSFDEPDGKGSQPAKCWARLTPPKNEKLPKHVIKSYGSTRNFKEEKRKQIQNVQRAMSNLRNGGFYLPGDCYKRLKKIEGEIKKMRDSMSVKNWGR